jgi:hypothetical protein
VVSSAGRDVLAEKLADVETALAGAGSQTR